MAATDENTIDFAALKARVTLLTRSGQPDQLHIREGRKSIQLSVRSGDVAAGPVILRFAIGGLRHLDAKVLTLRRLRALAKSGSLADSLFPAARQSPKWERTLVAHDLAAHGASQRQVAVALFGADVVARDWRRESDYLRLRVQRMLVAAQLLIAGGYLSLLASGRIGSF